MTTKPPLLTEWLDFYITDIGMKTANELITDPSCYPIMVGYIGVFTNVLAKATTERSNHLFANLEALKEQGVYLFKYKSPPDPEVDLGLDLGLIDKMWERFYDGDVSCYEYLLEESRK